MLIAAVVSALESLWAVAAIFAVLVIYSLLSEMYGWRARVVRLLVQFWLFSCAFVIVGVIYVIEGTAFIGWFLANSGFALSLVSLTLTAFFWSRREAFRDRSQLGW